MADFDVIVVGAGVIGLAISRQLALQSKKVLVLEKAPGIGRGISSRNSEVIHAGIYYPQRSLKRQFCVSGRRLLYAYLESRKLPYNKCGKIIVATDHTQMDAIGELEALARINRVEGIVSLDQSGIIELEPALSGIGGLFSSETGIFDSHAFMVSLQGDLENADGIIAFNAPFRSAKFLGSELVVSAGDDQNRIGLTTNYLVNSAGLWASQVAKKIETPAIVPETSYARGNYYTYSGATPFRHLVYPVPEPGGLGTHLTLDMLGRGRLGPDVEWIDDIDFSVNCERASKFQSSVSRYWPEILNRELVPDFCGIRPKLSTQGQPNRDFTILSPSDNGGLPVVQLFGIESPGLTSALAIGEYVGDMITRSGH